MAWQRVSLLKRRHRCIHRAAAVVAEHYDQLCAEHGSTKLQACQPFGRDEVAGDTDHEQVAGTLVGRQFWRKFGNRRSRELRRTAPGLVCGWRVLRRSRARAAGSRHSAHCPRSAGSAPHRVCRRLPQAELEPSLQAALPRATRRQTALLCGGSGPHQDKRCTCLVSFYFGVHRAASVINCLSHRWKRREPLFGLEISSDYLVPPGGAYRVH